MKKGRKETVWMKEFVKAKDERGEKKREGGRDRRRVMRHLHQASVGLGDRGERKERGENLLYERLDAPKPLPPYLTSRLVYHRTTNLHPKHVFHSLTYFEKTLIHPFREVIS